MKINKVITKGVLLSNSLNQSLGNEGDHLYADITELLNGTGYNMKNYEDREGIFG